MAYAEPLVSFLVLDFAKPRESRDLLESLRRHVLFPHKVIYLHNGPDEDGHAYTFYREGLVDQFIQTRVNGGLGLGTRDLFAACFSQWACYVQNDQVLTQDLTEETFRHYAGQIGGKLFLTIKDQPEPVDSGWVVASVSLAGQTCGPSEYSERAHIIDTRFYQILERELPLPHHGAGPHHNGEWREAAIQRYYRDHHLMHATNLPPLFADRGVWTIRDCAGGLLQMRTDTKALWWLKAPTIPYVFPELTPAEWDLAIAGHWTPGAIPVTYTARPGGSFNCWGDVPAPTTS